MGRITQADVVRGAVNRLFEAVLADLEGSKAKAGASA